MKIMFRGGTYGGARKSGDIENPNDSLIEEWVQLVAKNDGTINMKLVPYPKNGPQYIDLYAEGGRFLIMLLDIAENGEPDVITLDVESQPNVLEYVFGSCYPAKAITCDMKLACAVLKEFARTGNVSRKGIEGSILNPSDFRE